MENDLIFRNDAIDSLLRQPNTPTPSVIRRVLRQVPAVDAVPVERLGKIGKLFIPYSGCPRGPVGRMGEPVTLAEEAMFWGVIVDEDGTRFVPVVEEVLHELIEKASAVIDPESLRPKGRWVYDHWCEFKCSNCGEMEGNHETHGYDTCL